MVFKKFLAFASALALLCTCSNSIIFAEDDIIATGMCGDNITWYIEGSTLYLEGTGAMYDYDNYDQHSVDRAEGLYTIVNELDENYPWWDSDDITEIVMSDGITYIGNFAFFDFDNLESVRLPSDLVAIGDFAFAVFQWVSEEDFEPPILFDSFPDTLESIGIGAFLCRSYLLAEVELPDSLLSIGALAFSSFGDEDYTSVKIPKSVTEIGEYAIGSYLDSDDDDDRSGLEILFEMMDTMFWYPEELTNYGRAVDELTIYGYTGTIAEIYADTYGFTFIALDEENTLIGDVNGDTIINANDASEILVYVAKFGASESLDEYAEDFLTLADFHDDGVIDASDASEILIYAAENGIE